MDYKKPQSTLVQGGMGIYPLTTADQVILADGSRLEKDGRISADSAANSAKLGGKAPEYYLQPRNLLDNSNFRKPVNQRGKTSYSGTTYTIDRWWLQTDTGTASIGDNGLTLATNDSTSCKIMQYVEKLDINKVYTFVIKDTSENVYLVHSVPNGRNEEKTSFGSMIVNMTNLNNDNKSVFSISLDPGTTITLLWAALYEGSYTVDTLPPYVPKGYAAELAECQRYYLPVIDSWSMGVVLTGTGYICLNIPTNIKMRISPTTIISNPRMYHPAYDWVDLTYKRVDWYAPFYRIMFDWPSSLPANISDIVLINGVAGLSADL